MLKTWSSDPHHVIIVCEQPNAYNFSSQMGFTVIDGKNTDPTTEDKGGVDSKTVKLFSGIFGSPTSSGIGQTGSSQGYYKNIPCGTWSLALNADKDTTIAINSNNDIFFADGGYFLDFSVSTEFYVPMSTGCGINNNTDIVWCNLWAWAIDQVVNGSNSSYYINTGIPTLNLLTTNPSSDTNSGQIQCAIPIGYKLLGWQSSIDGGSTWDAISSTNNPYTFTNAINEQMYQAKLSSGSSCPTSYSSVLTIQYSLVTPVKISTFEATYINGLVNVSWVTTIESNNKGFYIQHSIDGKNFSNIGYVPSQTLNGNSNNALKYTYLDRIPKHNANNYYRLEQIDQDGKSVLSNIVTIPITSSDNETLKLYPNPVVSVATVSGLQVDGRYGVFSVEGKLVYSFVAGNIIQQVSFENLPAGIYFLKLLGNTTDKTIRFLKN